MKMNTYSKATNCQNSPKRRKEFLIQSMRASITLKLKTKKNNIRKKIYRPISLMRIQAKVLNKTLTNQAGIVNLI